MRLRWLLVGLLLFAAGCGSSKYVPVSGRVTLDGKPLVNATVVFEPQSTEFDAGVGSQAKTDSNGHFRLKLLTGQGDGALIGPHKVRITAYEGDDVIPSSGSDMKFRKRLVKTDLPFDVPPGGTSAANFDLPKSE